MQVLSTSSYQGPRIELVIDKETRQVTASDILLYPTGAPDVGNPGDRFYQTVWVPIEEYETLKFGFAEDGDKEVVDADTADGGERLAGKDNKNGVGLLPGQATIVRHMPHVRGRIARGEVQDLYADYIKTKIALFEALRRGKR